LMNDNVPRGRGAEQRRPGNWREGAGGGAPGGARTGGAAGGRRPDGTESFDGPIGENMTFSDGHETHRLFIREEAHGTTPIMASREERIEAKLQEWTSRRALLGPADAAEFDGLIPQARERARALDQLTDEQKSLKDAQRNAREVYERNRGRPRRRGNQPRRGRAAELRGRVRQAQNQLKETLRQLARLCADQPFRPAELERLVPMYDGGNELVHVRERGRAAHLRIANMDDVSVFSTI